MGDGAIEKEDAADGDFVTAPAEDHPAASAPDELEGEKGEVVAVDDEIGRAPFAAAADEGDSVQGGMGTPVGKEEAAGAGDLA